MAARKGQEIIAGIIGAFITVLIQFLLFSFYSPTWIAEIGGNPLSRLLNNLQPIPVLNQIRGSILVLLYPAYNILFSILNGAAFGSSLPPTITSLLVSEGLDTLPLAALNINLIDFGIYWVVPLMIAGLVTAVIAQEKARPLLLSEGLIVLILICTLLNEALLGSFIANYGGILTLNEIFLASYFYSFGTLSDPSSVISLFNSVTSISLPQNLLISAPYTLTFLITSLVAIGILASPFSAIANHVWKSSDSSLLVQSISKKSVKTNNHKNKIPRSVIIPSVTPPPEVKKPSAAPPKKPSPKPLKKPEAIPIVPKKEQEILLPPSKLELPSEDDRTADLKKPESTNFCSNCGAPLVEDVTFCEKCGW